MNDSGSLLMSFDAVFVFVVVVLTVMAQLFTIVLDVHALNMLVVI